MGRYQIVLDHYFEKQYWSHVERFPHFQEFDDDAFDELTGMTLYSAIGMFDTTFWTILNNPFADSSTSRDSTSASHYSADELQQLCTFTKNLRGAYCTFLRLYPGVVPNGPKALARSNKAFMSDPQSDLKAYVVSCIGTCSFILSDQRKIHIYIHRPVTLHIW